MDGQLKQLLKSFLLLKALSKASGRPLDKDEAAPPVFTSTNLPTNEIPSTTEDAIDHASAIRWFGTISQKKKKKKKDFLKAEVLEKEERPFRVGQVSSHGKYIADYHRNGNLVWHYHPEIAHSTDRFIAQNKNKYMERIKPEYRGVVSDMFDHVLKDPNRHVVAAFDKVGGQPSIRARHLKSLIEGQGHVKLQGHGPNDISLKAVRHGLGSNYNEQHIMPFSNKGKLAASEMFKSEMKRHLEELGHFEKADWRHSYKLTKEEDRPPMVLYHYSRQPGLKEIDPKQMGTGAPGSFSRHFNPSQIKDFPHTSFHYIQDTPEDIVRGGARSKYTIHLHPDTKLYDLSKDPDKLVHQAVQENQGAWNYENVLNKIKGAGYHGTWASQSQNPVIANTVQLFHSQPIHSEEGV